MAAWINRVEGNPSPFRFLVQKLVKSATGNSNQNPNIEQLLIPYAERYNAVVSTASKDAQEEINQTRGARYRQSLIDGVVDTLKFDGKITAAGIIVTGILNYFSNGDLMAKVQKVGPAVIARGTEILSGKPLSPQEINIAAAFLIVGTIWQVAYFGLSTLGQNWNRIEKID